SAGAVLVLAGSSSVDASAGLSFGGMEALFHIASGGTLNIAGMVAGSAGLTKTLSGVLQLSSPQMYTGMTSVNGGTLLLAGGNNTLLPGSNLGVNLGGLLDLGNTSQLVGDLINASARNGVLEGAGGIIQGSLGATLVTNQSNTSRTFAGSMQGGMNFVRVGLNSLFLNANNTFTGATRLLGGLTDLRDFGRLSGTTAVTLNYGELRLDNTGYSDLSGRINASAPISLSGGTLSVYGRAQTASVESLGALTLAQGLSSITLTPGGTGINSVDVTLASLTQSLGATVNFTNSNMGLIGSNPRLALTSALLLTNNILPWAVVAGADFASYVGYGTLGSAAAGG
ncbi:MAG: hypothetical protein EBR81_17935, partial [Proteobacteria bacterium]|nr:hypothetical protein [Pseudomonadota bacterium]